MKKQGTIFFLLFAILLFSCESVVEVGIPDHQTALVSNAFFNPDSAWQVHLSKSQGILENFDYNFVTNATVEIYSEGATVATLQHINNGFYSAENSYPEPGKSYTLRAVAPDLPAIEATDRIPAPAIIDSFQIAMEPLSDFETMLNCRIQFRDLAQVNNFYHLAIFVNRQPVGHGDGRYAHYFRTSDPGIIANQAEFDLDNDNLFSGNEATFDDALFSGQNYTIDFEMPVYELENVEKVEIQLSTISESFFKFFQTFKVADDGNDNPFQEATLIYNNVENGFGIFAGYSASVAVWQNPNQP